MFHGSRRGTQGYKFTESGARGVESKKRMSEHSLRVTYVGGPTVLVEWAGVKVLTDPTFDAAGGECRSGPVTLHKISGPAVSAAAVAGRVTEIGI